jgi:hypothetical protein
MVVVSNIGMVLHSSREGLETGSGRKNTSLDSSLATLHQAEKKVIPVVCITVVGLRIRITLMRFRDPAFDFSADSDPQPCIKADTSTVPSAIKKQLANEKYLKNIGSYQY